MTHAELVLRAEAWLKRQGCGVVFRDTFRAITDTGEQPDAIGFRGRSSILVEAKTSRSDFLADKKKYCRANPQNGMGDWRFYLCPPGVIRIDDLPEGWGLLYCHPRKIENVHGVPGNASWCSARPFVAAKECELQMMYSALRRMIIRGHFDQIYDGLPEVVT